MRGNKNQTFKKVDETVRAAYMRPQWSNAPTGRPNLNEINKRNAEERKKDRKSSYTVAGVMTLFTAFILVLVYYLS